MSEDGNPRSLEGRVAALEWEVRQLRGELIRTQGAGSRPSGAPPPLAAAAVEARFDTSAPARSTASSSRPAVEARSASRASPLDLETLVGRYGMLGLATLLALAAIGTFVSWAVARGLLGPTTRVAVGLVAAAAIAAAGLKLRSRSRSFGDSLLALALAAVHVCAWAAGPSLGLVPAPLALAFSALSSVALGAFALLEADEPLWCVGFGGACVAPFVTSTGQGTAPMLAAYATAVLVAGGSGLASRRWFVAGRIFAAGTTLFVVALLAMPAAQNAPLFAVGLPLVVAGFAVLPFARGEVLRPRLRTMGLLAAVASVRLAIAPLQWMGASGAAIAVGIAGCAWLVLLELSDGEPAGRLLDGLGESEEGPAAWIDGAVLPGLFLAALGIVLGRDAAPAFGVAAIVLLASAARRSEAVRDALAASTWAAAMTATWLTTGTVPTLAVSSLAWASIVLVWLGLLWVPSATWMWTSRLSLTAVGLWALALFAVRPQYELIRGRAGLGRCGPCGAEGRRRIFAIQRARRSRGVSLPLGPSRAGPRHLAERVVLAPDRLLCRHQRRVRRLGTGAAFGASPAHRPGPRPDRRLPRFAGRVAIALRRHADRGVSAGQRLPARDRLVVPAA